MFSMTVASDLCRCGGAPLKIHPILGVQFQKKNHRHFLFISGEQLSLNVAGDSAKTLSVLGNMGGVLDDCRLKFVKMCRRPLKIPPIFGVQRVFQNIIEKRPLQKSYQIDELTSQTLQSHVLYTYLPSALKIAN